MKKIIACIVALSLSVLVCCKKKKEEAAAEPKAPTVTHHFIPLKIGNYWIYNEYSIDPTGQESFAHVDSVYVSGDTTINNVSYFILACNPYSFPRFPQFLRQQNSDVVTAYGKYYYKNNDFTTVLHDRYLTNSYPTGSDTVSHIIDKMADNHLIVAVPLGTYSTETYQELIKVWPAFKQCCDTFYENRRFAENVGVVLETYDVAGDGSHEEIRLVRYHLN